MKRIILIFIIMIILVLSTNSNANQEITEITSLKDYYSNTYTKDNVSFTKEIHGSHINYKDSNGDMVPINLSFSDNPNYYGIDKASYNLVIYKDFSDTNLIVYHNKFEGANHLITYQPHSVWWINKNNINDRTLISNAQPVQGVLTNKNTIYYAGAFGQGLDFEITPRKDGFTKEIVIQNKTVAGTPPSANHRPVVLFKYSGNGLKVKAKNNPSDWNGVQYYDSLDGFEISENVNNNLKSYIQKAYVKDSNDNIQNIKVYWVKQGGSLWQAKVIPLGFMTSPNTTYPVRADTTTTFYPSAGDGYVVLWNPGSTWGATRDATTGSSSDSTGTAPFVQTYQSGSNYQIARAFFPFNTSTLPSGAIATSGNVQIEIYQLANNDDNDGDDFLTLVESTQASPTTLATTDYDEFGSVEFSDTRPDISTGQGTYTFNLNSEGLAHINPNGYTMFVMQEGHDFLNVSVAGSNKVRFYPVEQSGTANDPVLNITYVVPANISFVSPTPANNTQTTNTTISVNITLDGIGLSGFDFDWNGDNVTKISIDSDNIIRYNFSSLTNITYSNDTTTTKFYGGDTILMFNLDNNSGVGDSGNTINDTSPNALTGTLTNGAFYNTSGYRGQSVQFDGTNDYIDVQANSLWDWGSGEFTISYWFNAHAWSGYEILFNLGDDTNGKGFLAGFNNGQTRFWWSSDGSNWDLNAAGASSQYSQNVWHHVVLTRVGNSIGYYVDGAIEDTHDVSSFPSLTYSATYSDLAFGVYINNGATGLPFQGQMDEIRIYDYGMSAGDVIQAYKSNLKKYDSTTWGFEANFSQTVQELSVSTNEFIGTFKQINSTYNVYEHNQTGLSVGVYTYQGHSDVSGADSSTETRTINITGVVTDTTVTLNTPNNNSYNSNNLVQFNFTGTNAGGLANATVYGDWNGWGANNTNTTALTSGTPAIINVTGIPNGVWNWNVYVCGTDDNCEFSTNNFTLNNYPDLNTSFVNPTPAHASFVEGTSAIINATFTGPNIKDMIVTWEGSNETFISTTNLNKYAMNISLSGLNTMTTRNGSDTSIIHNDSLIVAYNFDNSSSLGESNSLIVDVMGNHNATPQSNPTPNSSGKFFGAYTFDDATNYVTITDHADFDTLNSSFTVEMWINSRDVNDARQPFFEKDLTSTPTGIMFELNAGTPHGNANAITVWNGFSSTLQSTTALSSNTWHHIAVTYDGSNLSLYIDGTYDMSTTETYGAVGTEDIRIGKADWSGPTHRYFNGHIDEFRIWNIPLSSNDIKLHYNSNLNKKDNSGEWTVFMEGLSKGVVEVSNGNDTKGFGKENDLYHYIFANHTGLLDGLTYTYSSTIINTTSGSVNSGDRTFNVGNQILTLSYPQNKYPFQKHNSTHAQIKIIGTYNQNFSNLEASFNGGAFVNINAVNVSNVYTGYFNASIGQGNLTIRDSTTPTVSQTSYNITLGTILPIWGQSNAEGYLDTANNLNTSNPYLTFVYKEDGSLVLANDQTDSDRVVDGSVWPLLADYLTQTLNEPIFFITSSDGGTSVTEWQKGQTMYDNAMNQISHVTNGTNRVGNVLFFQGERDARTDMGLQGDYDAYKGNLSKMADDFIADTTLATSVVVGQIDLQQSGSRTTLDNIRRAQSDLWDETNNVSRGPVTYDINMSIDSLHFQTDNEAVAYANRWKASVGAVIFGDGDGAGPKIANITINGTSTNFTLSFTETSTPLLIEDFDGNTGSKALGWYITNGSTVLTDVNVTSTTINGNDLDVVLNANIDDSYNVYYGSWNDSVGKTVLRDNSTFKLPTEPIWNYAITNLGAPTDTCTYGGSGDWLVDCSDNCVINSDTDLISNSLILSGSGSLTLNANILNYNIIFIPNSCQGGIFLSNGFSIS